MRNVISLVVILAAAGVSPAAVLYRANFDEMNGWRGVPANFSCHDGSYYSHTDGWLHMSSRETNPWVLLDVKHEGDGTFRGTVRNANGCHWSALVAKGVYRLEINREFVQLRLMRRSGDEWNVVATSGEYNLCARNTQQFELRLAFAGQRVAGFVDGKKLVEYDDPEPVPAGGDYSLLGGWGTDVAWRDVSVSDVADLGEWPYESLPKRAPDGLVEVTWVRGLSDDNCYFDGETAGFTLRLKCPAPPRERLRLRLRLVDVRGAERGKVEDTVSFADGGELERTVEFAPPARGCFKVVLEAEAEGEEMGWVEDVGSFTVLPRQLSEQVRNEGSYFGGHMDGINYGWHLKVARKLGVQWARCHDMLQQGWWTRVQPDGPEQWLWPYDEAQAKLDGMGFTTLGEFLWTPGWATSTTAGSEGNPSAYPPKDWEAFRRYVRQVVAHYQGSIKHWEVWNEPDYAGFWRGTPEEYAKLLGIVYAEAKQADPDATVVGGGGVSLRNLAWTRQMLAALEGVPMDAFSVHYPEPDLVPTALPELRKLLESHGIRVALWDTEESVFSTSFLDQLRKDRMEPEARYHFRNACCELVRTYMEAISAGVQRAFYYDLADPWRYGQHPKPRVMDRSPATGSFWDEGQMLKPTAAAHAALALALEGKTYKTRVTRGELEAFIFEGQARATAVQYATFRSFRQKAEALLRLPDWLDVDRLRMLDMMGNECGVDAPYGLLSLPASREPVYLTYEGDRAGDVLRGMYGGAELQRGE